MIRRPDGYGVRATEYEALAAAGLEAPRYTTFTRVPTATAAFTGVIVQLVIAALIVHWPLGAPLTLSPTTHEFPVPGTTLTLAVTVPRVPEKGIGTCLAASVCVVALMEPNAPMALLPFVAGSVIPPARSIAPVAPAVPTPVGP